MPLGMEVGLGLGDIVLDGDPAPPERGTAAPSFRPMSIVAKRSPISACSFFRCTYTFVIHCVSKSVTTLSCYNFDIHESISIIFGRRVTEKVSN